MLIELRIQNFAIIEEIHLILRKGLIVLTGETGAGKSIVIDALGMLRGDRSDSLLVRAGSDRARIEGVFFVEQSQSIRDALDQYGLYDYTDHHIIISREINRDNGRSTARINGRAVNLQVLREIGRKLIDIHGQHDGLAMYDSRTHLEILDRYGGLIDARDAVSRLVTESRTLREHIAQLRAAAASRETRIAELHQLSSDIVATAPQSGEEAALLAERSALLHGARIHDLIAQIYSSLHGYDDDRQRDTPLVEHAGRVMTMLEELAQLDGRASPYAGQAQELLYLAEDLTRAVRSYRDQFDFDPQRIDVIEERLTVLRDLQRRYRLSIDDLIDRAARAAIEIESLTRSDAQLHALEYQEQAVLAALADAAFALSRRRRATGDRLAAAIEHAVRELAMPHVRVRVDVSVHLDTQGLEVSTDDAIPGVRQGTRLAIDRTGIDRVEFQFTPNPGEPLRPLAKVASGGEGARLLLAVKSILSQVDDVPTLIFDEVDSGVGGRAGNVIGERLWNISRRHQVIVITHLPQVAAYAEDHYVIAKHIADNRTRTQMTLLTPDERISELASMLDGSTGIEHSHHSAHEMIQRAQVFRQQCTTASDHT
jgi:DNA repair protein RecN (Recombination protein N)